MALLQSLYDSVDERRDGLVLKPDQDVFSGEQVVRDGVG
jgi:hypothetical protein